MSDDGLEHSMIIATLMHKTEDHISEFARLYGGKLKSMGHDVQKARMRLLGLYEEAIKKLEANAIKLEADKDKKKD